MKSILLLLILTYSISRDAQTHSSILMRTITGQVLDDQGDPLFLARVQAKNEAAYTHTDIEGNFTLHLPDHCKTLIISAAGWNTLEVKIPSGHTLQIHLQPTPALKREILDDSYIHPTPGMHTLAGHTAGTASPKTNYSRQEIRTNVDRGTPPYIYPPPGQSPEHHTEDYSIIHENRFHRPGDAPLSTFSIDVDGASYANIRRFLNTGLLPPKDAVRIEEMVNYFDYAYTEPQGDTPFSIYTEAGHCPWNTQHRLVHIGLQGKRIPLADLPASNLVFLLDVSGSMDTPNKLPLVKSAFTLLTEQLREQDRVAIVVYAGSSGVVLPSTSGMHKVEILAALDKLHAGGSTAGAHGIRQAYEVARQHFITGGNNRVILATDGDFNVGVSSDAELVRIIEEERESGIFLTVLGFGMGNYKDNKMQQLAQHGNGHHAYVDDISEARKVFVHEFGGTLFTIAKDVKLQVEFNPALVAGYRLIGYENRMLQTEDFNDDKKDAGDIGSGHTVTALYEIIPAGVTSEFLSGPDSLRYQNKSSAGPSAGSDELMYIKIRYKTPEGKVSKLITHTVSKTTKPFDTCSEAFRWSAAVASYGLLLRDSAYKGQASFDRVKTWAAAASHQDDHGYKKEFLKLVALSGELANPSVQRLAPE